MVARRAKNLPAMQETQLWSLGQEDPLEKGIATHSSILTWRIPWTGSLAGYSPWGCKEPDTTEQLSMNTIYPVAKMGGDGWWVFKSVAHGTFYILHWRVVTHIKAAHEIFFFKFVKWIWAQSKIVGFPYIFFSWPKILENICLKHIVLWTYFYT